MVVFSLSRFVFELCLGSCLNLGFVFRFMPNIYFFCIVGFGRRLVNILYLKKLGFKISS